MSTRSTLTVITVAVALALMLFLTMGTDEAPAPRDGDPAPPTAVNTGTTAGEATVVETEEQIDATAKVGETTEAPTEAVVPAEAVAPPEPPAEAAEAMAPPVEDICLQWQFVGDRSNMTGLETIPEIENEVWTCVKWLSDETEINAGQ